MIEAIIFDMDGVVLDSERLFDQANEQFLQRFGKKYDRKKIKPLLSGRTLLESTQLLMEKYGITGDVEALTQERLERRKQVYAEATFIPGFLEFLKFVEGYPFRKAIATSTSTELIEIADRRLQLTQKFNGHIYSVSSIGCHSKPAPDIFLYTAEKLQTSPESCVVIEDATLGVQAALAAQMKVIGITTTYSRIQLSGATFIVDSYKEIEKKLQEELKQH